MTPEPSPTVQHDARDDAVANARELHRKQSRARVYRRGGIIMLAMLLVVVILSVVYVVANWHREHLAGEGLHFEIPVGAATTQVPTIDSPIAIPTRIRFTVDQPAVLTIRNNDSVANRARPWVIGPGQTFSATFDEPGTYEYTCSVDAAESVAITVEGD